ncbi:MAG: glycosyltransferase [Candidatus Nitrosopolaris sp.]
MAVDINFSLLLLSNCLIAINVSWIAIFILSIRSYHVTPRIDRGFNTRPRLQAISLSASSHQSVENVIGPSNRSGDLSNISLPFVSIIIPARNEEKNIKKCLSSLLNQNYPNFEVIAIDDSSTDNTLQIMNKIKKENDTDGLETIIQTSKFKIISLTDKPQGWTGKAWASHQGYLHAQGEILLFTDADTCFFDNDAILHAVSYLQNESLDVLTGHARLELPDFWSKIIMPLWDFFSIIRDQNPTAVNNTSSPAAYLVGSFYMMHRRVLEIVGGFQSVQGAIKEDVELGLHIKRAGFKLKIARMDKFYSALWSRDFLSLWHGIGRTFLPMSKHRVETSILSLFFLAILPCLIFPYSLSSYTAAVRQHNQISFNDLISSLILILNMSSCIMIIIGIAIKDVKNYSISVVYSLLTFPAALLLISACIANIVHFLGRSKRVQWRDRTYEYNRENKINLLFGKREPD